MQTLKIAVIGGGSSYTPELIEGIIVRYEQLPVTELALVDVESGRERWDYRRADPADAETKGWSRLPSASILRSMRRFAAPALSDPAARRPAGGARGG
jgi:hypothetical protein